MELQPKRAGWTQVHDSEGENSVRSFTVHIFTQQHYPKGESCSRGPGRKGHPFGSRHQGRESRNLRRTNTWRRKSHSLTVYFNIQQRTAASHYFKQWLLIRSLGSGGWLPQGCQVSPMHTDRGERESWARETDRKQTQRNQSGRTEGPWQYTPRRQWHFLIMFLSRTGACGSQDWGLYPFHPWMPLPWCLKSIIHVTEKAGCPSMTLLAVVVWRMGTTDWKKHILIGNHERLCGFLCCGVIWDGQTHG